MHNPFYFEEPFTKWQAWIDLCMMADSEETVKTSLKALKNRWLWGSTKKVRNYLETVSETGLATVKFTPNKGTLIRINTGNPTIRRSGKNGKKETVKETVSEIEELLPKEVVGGASLGTTPPNNNKKNTSYGKTLEELQAELGDEYE